MFAARHHGLITRDEWQRHGRSASAWYRAIERDEIETVHPGVARLAGTPDCRLQRLMAAVLAAGPGALASHRSAAHLWGVERAEEDPIDVLVVDRAHKVRLDGVVLHRPRDRLDLNRCRRAGIPTTNILRMLCDLGAVDRAGVNSAVGHVLTTGLASPRSIEAALRTHSRKGRHGIVALRVELHDWMIDGSLRDSELEKRMQALVRRYRLPRVQFHPVVAGFEVDFRVVGTPVLLECDGFDVHGRRDQFERDRRRDAELTAAGFVVVRFSWRALTRQPGWVATIIKRAVERWPHTAA